MQYSAEGSQRILEAIQTCLDEDASPIVRLNKVWGTLLITRGRVLAEELGKIVESKVFDGPFKGMILTREAISSYMGPILLGCYEHELHPTIEKLIANTYTRILNIGCSVGYYAVGLARRLPGAIVEAFDTDPVAQKDCRELAKVNGVDDRVHVHGHFEGKNFAHYTHEKTLIVMDIEGGEADLLRPDLYPALLKMDVLVELHDLIDASISVDTLTRFKATHTIDIIANKNALPDIPHLLPQIPPLDPFDQMLLGWEKRGGPTPWGVFTVKSNN